MSAPLSPPPQSSPIAYYSHPMPAPEPKNGFAITALVLGLVGIVFALIPLTGFIAAILGLVGLVFGLANIGRLRRGRSTAKVMTWFGSIISALVLAAGIAGMVIVFTAVDKFDEDLNCIDQAKTAKQIEAC
jgi:hypothetical protein